MVDASAPYRMNPLAALSIDRNALVRENYRAHGGIFYPAIHPLSGEKHPEAGGSLPLGYDLLYKPDVALLDGQKSANGYVGLYKNPPPGLQKHVLVPSAGGGEVLGLDRQVRPSDKQAELGLNGAGGFLRLPWISPYADATMYPFLDMAYKASFLSQPSPFIHQQLAYQSLCAAGAAGSSPGEERLFYLPHYASAHISSPLGPPIRIHAAGAAPVLSPLTHCQDKALKGLGLQVHQEVSAFSTSPQIHQEAQSQSVHHGSGATKSGQPTPVNPPSSKSGGNVGGSASAAAALESPPVTHSPRSALPAQPPGNAATATDLQAALYRSTSSSSTSLAASRPFYISSLSSGAAQQSSSSKTKDAGSDCCSAEKCMSPAKTSLDRAGPQKTAKNPGEKPLDLSAKELEANGFPTKLEALAKLGYLPPSRYALLAGQDQHLKEGLPTPVTAATKTPDRPDVISSVSSHWGVPGPSSSGSSEHSRASQSMKNKSMSDHPQTQISPGSTAGEVTSAPGPAARPKHSFPSQRSKADSARVVPPPDLEKVHPGGKGDAHSGKHNPIPGKTEAPDAKSHPPQQPSAENGNSSGKIYGDSYLPPGLGYTNRYIPYSVAENMSLQRMAMPGKGPVYPHPVLLGNNSFYPAHMAPKPGLPYGVHANQADYMTYQNPRGIAPPPAASHPGQDQLKSEAYRSQERPSADRSHRNDSDRDKGKSLAPATATAPAPARDDVVFIDLVRDEPEDDSSANKRSSQTPVREDSSRQSHIHDRGPPPPPPRALPPSQPPHTSQPHPSSPPSPREENPEETPEWEEPDSPLPDVPEELTMRCARTSPQQFSRKCKTGASGGVGSLMSSATDARNQDGDGRRSVSHEAKPEPSASRGVKSQQSPARNGSSLGPVSRESSSDCEKSSTGGAVCAVTASCRSDSDSPLGSSKPPACRDFSPQLPARSGFNPRDPAGGVIRAALGANAAARACHGGDANAPAPASRNPAGSCCRSARPPAGEPRSVISGSTHSLTNTTPSCRSVNPRFTMSESRNAVPTICGNPDARAPVCSKSCLSCPSSVNDLAKGPACGNSSSRLPAYGGGFPLGLTCRHLSPGGFTLMPADLSPDPPVSNEAEPRRDADAAASGGTQDAQDGGDPMADEDEGGGRSRLSGLTKRIANSSGYVGDRFKCVTTELYADSSKLSREQRALQRAMLRFSELELREREGGREEEDEEEEEEEEGMTAAAGETELADGQRGDGGGGEEDEEGEGGGGGGEWERCQHSERRGGGGGGRTPSAAAAEAPKGFHPSCPHSHLPIIPLYRHPDNLHEKDDGSAEGLKKKSEEEEGEEEEAGGPQEEKKKDERSFVSQQQRFLSTARALFQGNASTPGLAASNLGVAINRRRIFSLEPFHQSSIVSSRQKRGREEEKEEAREEEGNPNRKITNDSALEDVKRLKVCIELNGLRLNTPRLPGELSHWLPSRSAEVNRKFRMDIPAVRGRSEVNGGWCDRAFVRRDDPRVFHVATPSSPVHLPRQPCSPAPRPPSPTSFAALASSRLQDKHQRLRESRRVSSFLPSLPPHLPSSSSSPDRHPFYCHDDDLTKPKGKRPCKTKHTGGEAAREEGRDGGGSDGEDRSGKVSPCDPSRSPGHRPPSPQHTHPARPVPPEVRRLIVNKNAGETLLQRAARLGYEEVVLYCLERRMCDVNHRDNAGYCALHEACARGWLGIVRHLVAHGADVNCSAQDGTRPLHDAVENDHLEVVRFLLACGADPTLTSYSGRGPINMTHSAAMETFLEDYLSDLQGRSEGDPGGCWEFYGSSVCEPRGEGGVYDILANPPGPEDEEEEDEEEDEDEEQRARREVFEFELSDRPLLPCYNIQVSLCQGPRNWLLLADVLGRLRMTSRSFRRLFPQLNVQSVPEDEFYRQASLSQLLTGPDEQELASFRPDVKDPLELVEATPELAGMLGSSLEFVDTRWDSLEASPPPTPPPPPPPQRLSLRPPQLIAPSVPLQRQAAMEAAVAEWDAGMHNRTAQFQGFKNLGYSAAAAKAETKTDASVWEPPQLGSKNTAVPAKPNATTSAHVWEPQRHQSNNAGISNPANLDSGGWEQPQGEKCVGGAAVKPDGPLGALGASMWDPQRLRSRAAVTSDPTADAVPSEPTPSKDAAANPNAAADANGWKQQNPASGSDAAADSAAPGAPAEGKVREPQRPQSDDAGIPRPEKPSATVDADAKDSKRAGGPGAAPKRDADPGDEPPFKSIKLDAAWQRNLGNVRVHIRDLGLKVVSAAIRRDVTKEQGKAAGKGGKVKARS